MHNNVYISSNSVDRLNLHINIIPMKPGGYGPNLETLVNKLTNHSNPANSNAMTSISTIIYMPTIDGVNSVTSYLSDRLCSHNILVRSYHRYIYKHLYIYINKYTNIYIVVYTYI